MLALLLCFSLAACVTLPFGGKTAQPSTPAVAEARKAWTADNMPRAEKLYAALLKTTGITKDERYEAYSRYAMAAARNGKPAEGLKSLKTWQKEDPKARELAGWQDAWFVCARACTPSRAVSLAKEVWHDTKAPEGLRLQAACILTGRAFTAPQIMQIAPQMNAMYTHADKERQAAAEQHALMEIRFLTSSTLAEVVKQTPPGRDRAFPYSIFLLEQARRLAKSQPDQSAQLLARVRGAFADKNLPDSAMRDTASQGVCVVLALPTSGSVASIGRKVGSGASLAQQELGQSGVQVQLEILNTESPDWLSKLAALPPQCVVVGGPLQAGNFQQMKTGNALSRHAVFAFMPQLGEGEEGRMAWRFFASPQDQIEAVARLAYDDLGLRSFGAFYPEDAYGKRMTALFTQRMQQHGATVRAVGYEPEASVTWTDTAAQLMQDGSGTNSQPDAVFLPDSWKKMDMLTKSFQYYGGNRMVMLGTALWEQGLSGRFVPQVEKYGLAVFPAAWNPENIPATLSAAGKADFWKGLGYDFVRFAAHMDLSDMSSPADVTARARRTQMNWAMAPISWDEQGQAHQALHMFTPTAHGMSLLNVDSFKLLRQNALNSTPAQAEGQTAEQPQGDQTQGTQQQQPLSNTPRPSYKLHLPGAK